MDITTIDRHLKEAREREVVDRNKDGRSVSIYMLLTLAEMAANNIAPDGTFSDAEVDAWEAMRYAIALSK
jgi:DNA-binding transcriptional ArsR family regulator